MNVSNSPPDLAVILLATDADRTAAFYRDTLGVPLITERHDGRHTHYACRLGSAYFTIQPRSDFGAPPPSGYTTRFNSASPPGHGTVFGDVGGAGDPSAA